MALRNIIVPKNYEEMIELFGDIREYLYEDGTLKSAEWESEILDIANLPFSMKLSWNKNITVTRFRCHRMLKFTFEEIFKQIAIEKLIEECQFFGGCYMFRAMRRGKKISTHAWGIAIDLNPDTNQLGQDGDMHPRIIDIFEYSGFVWGGGFRDPMHYQFCLNY